jgi:predicted DNA-binding transcriptional regulator AlpA
VTINDRLAAYRRENAKLRRKPCGCKPHFISTVKLAKELHVAQSLVRCWISRGLLPQPCRVGRSLVWSVSELEEWFAKNRQAPWKRKARATVFSKPMPADGAAVNCVEDAAELAS